MRVPLRYRRIAVPQYLLHLIDRSARVDQEGRVLMPKIMDTQMGQASLFPQPRPDLHDRGVRLAGFLVDEKMRELPLGIQLGQNIQSRVIQGHRPDPLRLAVFGRNAPDPIHPIKLTPRCRQSFIEAAPDRQQEEGDVAHGAILIGAQYCQQPLQLGIVHVVLHLVVRVKQRHARCWIRPGKYLPASGNRNWKANTYRQAGNSLVPYQPNGSRDWDAPVIRIEKGKELVPYSASGNRVWELGTYRIEGGRLIPYKSSGSRDFNASEIRIKE